jgi:hypothetical protein
LQVPAVFSLPPLHEGALQTVSTAYFAHPPEPSQTPVSPQVEASDFTQIARGSATPAATGAQMPGPSVWLQVTQGPVQALLQQTPSTQKPEAHWLASLQGAAVCRLPQLPFTHLMFAAQSLSEAHCVRQALVAASQLNGEQILAGPVTQLPAPSQTRTPCTDAPLHEPAWQTVPAV